MDESSIGPWLRSLKASDSRAMQVIWERFFESLVSFANRRLGSDPRLKGTGEDVAASVFESLWRGCQEGRFQNVTNHSELWWTLLKMARQKCVSHARRELAAKRGGKAKPLSLQQPIDDESGFYHSLVSEEPDPQYLAAVVEESERCMSLLRDEIQRRIAALSMEGHSTSEIAEIVDVSESSVRRKLDLALTIWKRHSRGESNE